MMNTTNYKNPEIERIFSPDALDTFKSSKHKLRIPAGSYLYGESDKCEDFMLLLGGSFRVFKNAENGREVTIYRVFPGEQCVLSLHSLLSGDYYLANAIAETELILLTLSKAEFFQLIDESCEFQHYLLKYMSQNLCDVVKLVSEVAFQQINVRLASILKKLFTQSAGEPIKVTHGQLAKELGTTREVISRTLKELENQRCIKLSRGRINLLSYQSLDWFT